MKRRRPFTPVKRCSGWTAASSWTIWYNDGAREDVNVSCNSYAAIIKDVMKHI